MLPTLMASAEAMRSVVRFNEVKALYRQVLAAGANGLGRWTFWRLLVLVTAAGRLAVRSRAYSKSLSS